MRSNVVHKAKCGQESAYFCRQYGQTGCSKHHTGCRYKLKTVSRYGQPGFNKKNEIHPLAIELTKLYTQALREGKGNTAWCID